MKYGKRHRAEKCAVISEKHDG